MRYFLAFVTVLSSLAFPPVVLANSNSIFPTCESPNARNRVVSRFNQADRVHWQRGLVMRRIEHARERDSHGFLDSAIERRWCSGTAIFDDGHKRRVHYVIERDAGFAGFALTWSAEFCVNGLDPWKYYDGECRVLTLR